MALIPAGLAAIIGFAISKPVAGLCVCLCH